MKVAEKRTLKKREEIFRSAIKIVNDKGYSGATVEEIAGELFDDQRGFIILANCSFKGGKIQWMLLRKSPFLAGKK